MAPIVAPGVVRYTIVGELEGEDCFNILDVNMDPIPPNDRADMADELAGDILNNWNDEILPFLSDQYTAIEVRFVDLDSADGATGSRSTTDGADWPSPGGTGGQPLPNNTYAKIQKQLNGKTRQQRNGTMRVGGILEPMTEATNGNRLTDANVTAINTAFEDFKDGINGVEVGQYTANIVVVHTVGGVYDGQSTVANFICQPTVGTLRRRMPGYGT